MLDIEARAKPDLENSSRQSTGQFAAPLLESGGPTRSVDQDWEDVLAVETHVARVPTRFADGRRARSSPRARSPDRGLPSIISRPTCLIAGVTESPCQHRSNLWLFTVVITTSVSVWIGITTSSGPADDVDARGLADQERFITDLQHCAPVGNNEVPPSLNGGHNDADRQTCDPPRDTQATSLAEAACHASDFSGICRVNRITSREVVSLTGST